MDCLSTIVIALRPVDFRRGHDGLAATVQNERQPDLRLAFAPAVPEGVVYKDPVVRQHPPQPMTAGACFRGIGWWGERDSTGSFSGLETGTGQRIDISHDQTISGVVGGFDGRFYRSNHAWIVGVMGGYVRSDLEFGATGSEWTFEGPTVGAYATFITRRLYVDMLVKADFLDIDFNTTAFGAGNSGDGKVTNVGGRIDTGYKIDLGSFFIEPQGTLAYVRSDLSDMSIASGTISADGDSLRGRLGLRAGREWQYDVRKVGLDATASVWHEFLDDNKARVSGFGIPEFTTSLSETETFGEVGGGITVVGIGGWSSFVRGKYQFASDLSAGTVSAGLRYDW